MAAERTLEGPNTLLDDLQNPTIVLKWVVIFVVVIFPLHCITGILLVTMVVYFCQCCQRIREKAARLVEPNVPPVFSIYADTVVCGAEPR